MKIATFNVNGVNGRLPVLMRWLAETKPDVACLQELKAPNEKFPEPAIREAGYGAVWRGQKSWNGVAILARNRAPMVTRRGLPADPDDVHSRYIEAAVDGLVIGCLFAQRKSRSRPEVRLKAALVRSVGLARRGAPRDRYARRARRRFQCDAHGTRRL